MICPVCQSDKLRIFRRPKRTDKADLREIYCEECGQHYYTETKITDFVKGKLYSPIDKAENYIEEHRKGFFELCRKKSIQNNLFEV